MTEKFTPDKLLFSKLSDSDVELITTFQNKEKDLVDFLIDDAIKNQCALISTTYLVFVKETDSKLFVAYVSLLSDSVKLKENKELETKFIEKGIPYSYLPSMKIGRMAVDDRYQGKGVGSAIMDFSIGMAFGASQKFGCRFLTADSKPNAKGFYEKHGFKIIKEKPDRPFPMFLDLLDIRRN